MARTGAIVIRWDRVAKGREAMALEAFGQALGYFEELAKEGRIVAHREYFASNGEGMMVVEGLLPELYRIVQEDDHIRNMTRGGAVTEGLTMQVMAGGSDQTVQELIGITTGVEAELGLL
ncbi:MAG TPA: hypothetical protein VM618_12215 [Acidimicrobiia bacterium]|nr:hypothetical protein [Acidimicrobiia bacterium]